MDLDVEKRYKNKILIINGIDPYSLDPKTGSTNVEDFPKCNLWSIGNYLVFKTSEYTKEDFNAFKSLEAYNQFSCGWVREVSVHVINSWHVVTGKVMHSMRLNEKPLQAWIIAAKNGEIQSAHCSCMAGLAEACKHVAAILFYLENATNMIQEKSVTDVPAYWTAPSAIKKVNMLPIDEISFAKKKLCTINENVSTPKKERGSELSDDEYKDFLQKLSAVETSSPIAILLTESPFCDRYTNPRNKDIASVCSDPDTKYPPKLRDLFREDLQRQNETAVLNIAEKLSIEGTAEQCEALEKDTRQQSSSKLWFHYRAGRITASVMKRVCTTSLLKPSMSLIKQIVYPEKMKFISAATQWGSTHEETARKTYEDIAVKTHSEFKFNSAGFFLSKQHLFLGATPDGIVSCMCCGKGCLEIKCPYCIRDKAPEDLLESNFLDEASKCLKKDHAYYYQIQTQLFVTELQYCDFVAWNKNCIFIQRILPDVPFWNSIFPKANSFFRKVILPELLTKMWTDNIKENKSPILIKLSKD